MTELNSSMISISIIIVFQLIYYLKNMGTKYTTLTLFCTNVLKRIYNLTRKYKKKQKAIFWQKHTQTKLNLHYNYIYSWLSGPKTYKNETKFRYQAYI